MLVQEFLTETNKMLLMVGVLEGLRPQMDEKELRFTEMVTAQTMLEKIEKMMWIVSADVLMNMMLVETNLPTVMARLGERNIVKIMMLVKAVVELISESTVFVVKDKASEVLKLVKVLVLVTLLNIVTERVEELLARVTVVLKVLEMLTVQLSAMVSRSVPPMDVVTCT